MSKNIPTAGKVWLIIYIVLQVLNVLGAIVSIEKNTLWASLVVISAVEAVILFLLLKGKGKKMFIAFIICHLVNVGVSLYLQPPTQVEHQSAYMVGTIIGLIIGLVIAFVPTYFAVRKTFEKKEAK